jgi:hypothetical protein
MNLTMIVILGVFVLGIYLLFKRSKNEENSRRLIQERTKHEFEFGRYLYGFTTNSRNVISTCHDTGDIFEFHSGPLSHLGSISKKSIFKINIFDKTSFKTNFSALGIATFGALGLFSGQNVLTPAFYLIIFYRENNREIPVVFEFNTIQKAYEADEFIRKYAEGTQIESLSPISEGIGDVDKNLVEEDIEEKFKKLQSLKNKGLIGEEEYNKKKTELLSRL